MWEGARVRNANLAAAARGWTPLSVTLCNVLVDLLGFKNCLCYIIYPRTTSLSSSLELKKIVPSRVQFWHRLPATHPSRQRVCAQQKVGFEEAHVSISILGEDFRVPQYRDTESPSWTVKLILWVALQNIYWSRAQKTRLRFHALATNLHKI